MGCCSRETKGKGLPEIVQNRGCKYPPPFAVSFLCSLVCPNYMDTCVFHSGTDILFLLAFLFAWLVSGGVLILARDKGADPWRVVRGVDMYGRICGIDDGVDDKKLAAFPDADYSSYIICVDKCDRTNEDDYKETGDESYGMVNKYESVEFLGYCMPNLVSGSVSLSFQTDSSGTSQTMAQAVADTFNAWVLIAIRSAFSPFLFVCA